jgi:hypothetical protein
MEFILERAMFSIGAAAEIVIGPPASALTLKRADDITDRDASGMPGFSHA